MAGKKEYTLQINGVTQNVKDVTSLESAIKALDSAIAKTNSTEAKSAAASKTKSSALTEEEKAAKRLSDTQKKLASADSEANKAQISATKALQEKTREVTRSISINKLAEGSIAQMGMQLTDLRVAYEALSATQRADIEVGGKMITQIQSLDAEYKALRESTGNFRDSVGNYEKGYKGLQDLTDKFELATRGSVGMATEVLGSNAALETLGSTTNVVARSTEGMAGILALASTASEAYNAVVKEGWIQEKTAAVVDGVRTVQLRAKTAAEALGTKGTLAATIAQKLFNIVAAANPYVLLALALITVVGAIAAFMINTNKAAESQKKANELEAIHLDYLEHEVTLLKEAGDARVKSAETQVSILTAQGAKTKDIRAAEDALAAERVKNNAQQRGFYAKELASLDSNKKKVELLTVVLNKLRAAQAKGKDKLTLDIDLNGKVEKVKIEDAINSVQGAIDNFGRKVSIATNLNVDQTQIQDDIAIERAARLKADKDLAKERKSNEIDATRATEDARIALIQDSYEQQRETIKVSYSRQIQDLKRNLEEQNSLQDSTITLRARRQINAKILLLQKQQTKDLVALAKEQAQKELDIQNTFDDALVSAIAGQNDRARTEINIKYDRQIADIKKRLRDEKDLTISEKQKLNDTIVYMQDAQANELLALSASQMQTQSDQQLTSVQQMLDQVEVKVGEYTKRSKTGLHLIDVEATKASLSTINSALGEYISGLTEYQGQLSLTHQATLDTLKKGTTEYEAEMQKYAAANTDVTSKIKGAQKEQVENTKASKATTMEYYRDLFDKISGFAAAGATAVTAVTDTITKGLQAEIDDLNDELDVINDKYEEAKTQREDAVTNTESIEEQLQAATGGTADALKSQLADSMHARQEAEREEKRLAKEKEKREAEIAKKEKQQKRMDLISQIAQGIANTAEAITGALKLTFPLNLVVAGIVGAAGAVQVGIITKQLAKLADGGEIKGASHANGGARITGTNIEVEGGEYVVNKDTTQKNKKLIKYINSQRKEITHAEIASFFSKPANATSEKVKSYLAEGGEIPSVTSVTTSIDYAELADAMSKVNIAPVVAVTDIIDATDRLTSVRDLAGF